MDLARLCMISGLIRVGKSSALGEVADVVALARRELAAALAANCAGFTPLKAASSYTKADWFILGKEVSTCT